MNDASTPLPSEPTSVSLLRRVQSGDAGAWRTMAGVYGPLVYRWARQAGLKDDEAADIGQEVFRTLAERIGSFRHDRPGDTFCGWLWTITRNKLGDHFRRQARSPRAAGGSDAAELLNQIPDPLSSEAADSDQTELVHRILRLIQTDFTPTTWQAFWRSTVDGHATEEIAQSLSMSSKAVRQAKYRVLRRLREELGGLQES